MGQTPTCKYNAWLPKRPGGPAASLSGEAAELGFAWVPSQPLPREGGRDKNARRPHGEVGIPLKNGYCKIFLLCGAAAVGWSRHWQSEGLRQSRLRAISPAPPLLGAVSRRNGFHSHAAAATDLNRSCYSSFTLFLPRGREGGGTRKRRFLGSVAGSRGDVDPRRAARLRCHSIRPVRIGGRRSPVLKPALLNNKHGKEGVGRSEEHGE